ncbi:glycosyltransferase family 2 protein [Candidatus Omnitrophota bacterium]
MSVSIVMPCYNEEGIIEKTVRAFYDEIDSVISDSEFIVIDDCSIDNTYNILEKLKSNLPKLKILKTPINSGHGKAMWMGYEQARKEWVFQVDSDGQFEARDFRNLYALKNKYDFILGFRTVRHDPTYRLLLAKIIRAANFVLFGTWIRDANCPFRLIKKEILDEILQAVDKETLTPNIMISILAKKKKINMIEVPVTHYKRKTGVVSIANWNLIKFALKGLGQLISFRKKLANES